MNSPTTAGNAAGKVACVGLFVVDALAKPVDRFPERGKSILFDQLELHTGGGANNTGTALARLGIPVTGFGKIGTDAFGDFVLQHLTRNGVSTAGIRQMDGVNTSFTFVAIHGDSERSFFHTIGANGEFAFEDLDLSLIEESAIVHVTGAMLMPKFDGAPTARLMKWARERGIVTALDTSWNPQARWFDILEKVLPHLDYFMPSVIEAQEITGRRDIHDIAAFLLDHGVGTVILKMGENGSYIQNAEVGFRVPALKVAAVDATGAGDAYAGGFVAGLAMGWNLERCAQLGTATGAACVTAIGTTPGLRDLDGTWELWKKR